MGAGVHSLEVPLDGSTGTYVCRPPPVPCFQPCTGDSDGEGEPSLELLLDGGSDSEPEASTVSRIDSGVDSGAPSSAAAAASAAQQPGAAAAGGGAEAAAADGAAESSAQGAVHMSASHRAALAKLPDAIDWLIGALGGGSGTASTSRGGSGGGGRGSSGRGRGRGRWRMARSDAPSEAAAAGAEGGKAGGTVAAEDEGGLEVSEDCEQPKFLVFAHHRQAPNPSCCMLVPWP